MERLKEETGSGRNQKICQFKTWGNWLQKLRQRKRKEIKNALHFIAQYTSQSIWQKLSFFIPTSNTRFSNEPISFLTGKCLESKYKWPQWSHWSPVRHSEGPLWRGLLRMGAGEHHGLGVFPEVELSVRLERRARSGRRWTFWKSKRRNQTLRWKYFSVLTRHWMAMVGRWLWGSVDTKYHCWDWLHPSEFLNHQPKEMGFFLFTIITCRLRGRFWTLDRYYERSIFENLLWW